jgi:hypothetical protein
MSLLLVALPVGLVLFIAAHVKATCETRDPFAAGRMPARCPSWASRACSGSAPPIASSNFTGERCLLGTFWVGLALRLPSAWRAFDLMAHAWYHLKVAGGFWWRVLCSISNFLTFSRVDLQCIRKLYAGADGSHPPALASFQPMMTWSQPSGWRRCWVNFWVKRFFQPAPGT